MTVADISPLIPGFEAKLAIFCATGITVLLAGPALVPPGLAGRAAGRRRYSW